jgi:XTP/dITP diphosphohydrolase
VRPFARKPLRPEAASIHRLLIATTNKGKVAEIRRILGSLPLDLVTPDDLLLRIEVEEDGATYLENATKKARAYAEASGIPALADDSGIELDALGGEPGIHSARYGGPGLDDRARVDLLLSRLRELDAIGTPARFRAVVVLALPDGTVQSAEGVCEGVIAPFPRGENGFGYDPVFLLADGRTTAELAETEKDAMSHRGKALRALRPAVSALVPGQGRP